MQVGVVFSALIFPQASAWTKHDRASLSPRLGKHLGVLHRDFICDRVLVHAREFFDHVQFVAMKRTVPASQVLSLNPMASTTNVSPSQWPTESPMNDDSRSSGCFAPIGITRNTWNTSNNITTSCGVCTICMGNSPMVVVRGTPGDRTARHRIVDAAPVERFQNLRGSPRLIGRLLRRAANRRTA